MDFAFSEEQELLRGAAREFLADRYPAERVVALADTDEGADPATWSELAELGWLDPELGFLEHAVLLAESAAALLPAPYFSTVGLTWPLLDDELRGAVGRGERSVGLAWAEPGGPATLAGVGDVATTADGDGRLSGRKALVPDSGLVSDVLVAASGPGGAGWYAVETAAAGVTVRERSTVDRTRRLGDLVLDGAPARRLATAGEVGTTMTTRALAAAAWEAVGVAQRALDLATEHAKTREAFGRPIGVHQAISHRIADVFTEVELARSLATWAGWAVAESAEEAPLAAAAAKSAAGEAAVFACESAIQVHGGVGFTWEHVLHRYYKRAQWLAAFEGDGPAQRAKIADAVLAG
jgi:alkylation response protein AidB-like acyl-CoA dehydrogenase